jgi:DNA primase
VLAQETIDAVRERVSVADVVGERIKLERRGRSLVGLCPFHKEKTPSFHVNEERGFYHCFGCHASGDAIKFVQETDGLGFMDAIRELAQKFGIEVVETRGAEDRARQEAAQKKKNEHLHVIELAARFFEESLRQHPLGHHARQELARRGLEADGAGAAAALEAFRVGYAPHSWDALATHLRGEGASLQAAEAVGLVGARKQGGGYYDRFRHRLMFAIVDLRGKVVAFSGRALDAPIAAELQRLGLPSLGDAAESVAKYMNSPESAVYKKRETVFGLFQARDAVRQANECVLVEGNFDVMSLHARGIQHVVAPLGTAFTREQAAQIRRYTSNVTLLFDGDGAGLRATRAAREPCKEEGLVPRVARLPKGSDPDDFIRSRGAESVSTCLRNATGMLEFLIEDTLTTEFHEADAEARGRKVNDVLELIRGESDPTVRAMAQSFADTVAQRLGIHDVDGLRALSRAIRGAAREQHHEKTAPLAPPERARSRGSVAAIEAAILGALVEYPSLLQEEEVRSRLAHAEGTLALAIVALQQHQHDLVNQLPAFGNMQDVVARHLAAPELLDDEMAREMVLDNLHRLARLSSRRTKADVLAELRRAAQSGDVEAELRLLTELQEAAREHERQRQRLRR